MEAQKIVKMENMLRKLLDLDMERHFGIGRMKIKTQVVKTLEIHTSSLGKLGEVSQDGSIMLTYAQVYI